jgi:hypothetical protein
MLQRVQVLPRVARHLHLLVSSYSGLVRVLHRLKADHSLGSTSTLSSAHKTNSNRSPLSVSRCFLDIHSSVAKPSSFFVASQDRRRTPDHLAFLTKRSLFWRLLDVVHPITPTTRSILVILQRWAPSLFPPPPPPHRGFVRRYVEEQSAH